MSPIDALIADLQSQTDLLMQARAELAAARQAAAAWKRCAKSLRTAWNGDESYSVIARIISQHRRAERKATAQYIDAMKQL